MKIRKDMLTAVVVTTLIAATAIASQLHLNLGTSADDHTGDPIRTAMGKVETNFTDVYTQLTNLNNGSNGYQNGSLNLTNWSSLGTNSVVWTAALTTTGAANSVPKLDSSGNSTTTNNSTGLTAT